jgi:hypothetical protein
MSTESGIKLLEDDHLRALGSAVQHGYQTTEVAPARIVTEVGI